VCKSLPDKNSAPWVPGSSPRCGGRVEKRGALGGGLCGAEKYAE
jgi:hypothetical protein